VWSEQAYHENLPKGWNLTDQRAINAEDPPPHDGGGGVKGNGTSIVFRGLCKLMDVRRYLWEGGG